MFEGIEGAFNAGVFNMIILVSPLENIQQYKHETIKNMGVVAAFV